jgi:hypothetical protein
MEDDTGKFSDSLSDRDSLHEKFKQSLHADNTRDTCGVSFMSLNHLVSEMEDTKKVLNELGVTCLNLCLAPQVTVGTHTQAST